MKILVSEQPFAQWIIRMVGLIRAPRFICELALLLHVGIHFGAMLQVIADDQVDLIEVCYICLEDTR